MAYPYIYLDQWTEKTDRSTNQILLQLFQTLLNFILATVFNWDIKKVLSNFPVNILTLRVTNLCFMSMCFICPSV